MSEMRIELLRTEGQLFREGQGISIENNVWIIGNDTEVIVIDAAHNAQAIADAVGDRDVHGILLTHGHEDHVNAALDTASALDAELWLHPADEFLWRESHPESTLPTAIAHGSVFRVGTIELDTVHTPGHTPGSVCFIVRDAELVFSGDTLFQGGPGATRWQYSSFAEIIESIEQQLFTLPPNTRVLPGHGEATTVAAERLQLQAYKDRGW